MKTSGAESWFATVGMAEQTIDVSTENHVPIVEKGNDGYTVTVGMT